MPGNRSGGSHSLSSFSSSRSSFSSSSSSSWSSRPSRRSNSSHSSYTNSYQSKSNRSTHSPMLKKYFNNSEFNSRPTRYFCNRHTYIYFPVSWTDNSGKYYEKGYYDENNKYYKELNSKSEFSDGLLLKCPFCDTSKLIKWDKVTNQIDLTCPNCSGQMEIESSIDQVLSKETVDNYEDDSSDDLWYFPFWQKFVALLMAFIACFAGIFISWKSLANSNSNFNGHNQNNTQEVITIQNPSENKYGKVIYLLKTSKNTAQIQEEYNSDVKTFSYSEEDDAYYCTTDDYWIAYNNNVSPEVWQYWYEPISGNAEFNGYGWMEYDLEENRWWIEYDYGKWKPLEEATNQYDISNLYFIEN